MFKSTNVIFLEESDIIDLKKEITIDNVKHDTSLIMHADMVIYNPGTSSSESIIIKNRFGTTGKIIR